MKDNKTVFLKLTSAISIGGEIVRPGAVREFSESDAISLLNRGRAELATEADMPADTTDTGADTSAEDRGAETSADAAAGGKKSKAKK